jgi:hypothetical protein
MYRLGLYQSEQLVAAPLGSVDAAVVPHVLRSLPFLEVLAIHLGMNIFTQNQNRWTKKTKRRTKTKSNTQNNKLVNTKPTTIHCEDICDYWFGKAVFLI